MGALPPNPRRFAGQSPTTLPRLRPLGALLRSVTRFALILAVVIYFYF